jgi:hypothetical protein
LNAHSVRNLVHWSDNFCFHIALKVSINSKKFLRVVPRNPVEKGGRMEEGGMGEGGVREGTEGVEGKGRFSE